MNRGMSGQYEVTVTAGETVRAFVPDSLPPTPALDLHHDLQLRLEQATLALGRLDSISLLLPDPNIFLYSYIRKEAVLSSQIEGTQSSLSDLLLFELDEASGVPFDDVVEVSSYVAALEHGMTRLNAGFPICNRLIREMHGVLLAKGRGQDKSPGQFRKTQNWIGGTRPGNAHFVPPPPAEVERCMTDLESYVHDETSPYPFLIKAALVHVQFETIHPFLDGNGRIGRLLIAFLLHHGRVLTRPLLYLSLYFKRHRTEYYRLLDQVRTEGDWESWVLFFLEGVQVTASNAVETATNLVGLMNVDARRIREIGRSSSTALRVFDELCRRPITNVTDLSERTGLSFPTVKKAITHLENLGVVTERTGNRRNRVFVYEAYLRLLNAEA